MCSFPKDPTDGLFDFNKDGKLDAVEYTLMYDVLYHDSDEDTDDTEDSDFDDIDDDINDEEDDEDEDDGDDSF